VRVYAVPLFRRLFRFTSRATSEIDTDVNDEIAFHLEMRVRELMNRGWSVEAAQAEAARQFGDQARTASYCRRLDADKERHAFQIPGRRALGSCVWRANVQPAARLSAVALLTIALGIGATTLVFSVVTPAAGAPAVCERRSIDGRAIVASRLRRRQGIH
jgi:hypothetical protein